MRLQSDYTLWGYRDVKLGVVETVAAVLAAAGFIAACEEAEELVAAAAGDRARLDGMVTRRLTGEPLAWITGRVSFCGVPIRVDRGVYVPRCQSESLALRAAAHLPARGVAVDLCTGSGAIARVLQERRPHARVVASDVDQPAVACAKSNDVEADLGDLFAPLPRDLQGRVDVVVAVVPYVPTPELTLLQRDTFTFESTLAYDGGVDGADILRRVVVESARWLRTGGALLLELGGAQADAIAGDLTASGFAPATILRDDDGDVRGIDTTLIDAVARVRARTRQATTR